LDFNFWLGIIVATILAVPAGVIAIALHSRIVRYLDSRRITSHEKRAQAARRFYQIIQDLRSGRRDKYIYMLRGLISIILSFVLGVIALVGAGVILALTPLWSSTALVLDWSQARPFIITLFLFFVTYFGMFICFAGLRRFRRITNALEDFDTYERDFLSKWGTQENMDTPKPPHTE
jgi:hypothetical protein